MNSLVWTSTAAFVASAASDGGGARAGAALRHRRSDPTANASWHGRPVAALGRRGRLRAHRCFGLLAVRPSAPAARRSSPSFFQTHGSSPPASFALSAAIDDRFNLPSRIKLALQIVSVLPIVMLGYYGVDRIVAFGCPIELGWFGIPLTILWLVRLASTL